MRVLKVQQRPGELATEAVQVKRSAVYLSTWVESFSHSLFRQQVNVT